MAGFGLGLLSSPAQIATISPQLSNRFSYCLFSHSFNQYQVHRSSALILGHYDDKERKDDSGIDGCLWVFDGYLLFMVVFYWRWWMVIPRWIWILVGLIVAMIFLGLWCSNVVVVEPGDLWV